MKPIALSTTAASNRRNPQRSMTAPRPRNTFALLWRKGAAQAAPCGLDLAFCVRSGGPAMDEFEGIVETAVYADDLAAAEAFYGGVLGLPVIGREAGRHVFFRVGDRDVLLIFNPATTRHGGHVP